jgi:hypothetical protein
MRCVTTKGGARPGITVRAAQGGVGFDRRVAGLPKERGTMKQYGKRVWALNGLFWLGTGLLVGAWAAGCGAAPGESFEEPIAQNEERAVTTITTLAQLRAMPLNCECVLGANINANATQTAGQEFVPIGNVFTPFTGSFDGAGFTINNLKIKQGLATTGLFSATNGATIHRAALTNVSVTGTSGTGALVGNAAATAITESYVTGTVTGTTSGSTLQSDMGMLVGAAWALTSISRSYATGTLNGAIQRAGGLIGATYGNTDGAVLIDECFTNVTLTTNAAASSSIIVLGGLIGRVTGAFMNNVYTIGSQTARAPAYVGGIVGEAEGGLSGIPNPIIRGAFSRGAVTIPATPAVDRAGAIGKHDNEWAWCSAMWDSTVDPGTPRPDSATCQGGVSTTTLRSAYINYGPYIFGEQTTDPTVPSYPGGSDGSWDLALWNHNSSSQHTTLKGIPDAVQPK